MSVGARHQYRRVARTREKRTRETVEQYATYTRAENENGSCSCAPLPRALRRSTLFGYDFTGLSFFLYLFPPSLPPSSSSSSFARLSFPPAASTQRRSSPRRTSATRLRPSLFTAAVTRTHTHTRTQGRARPRGPPDSSPAPRQTPNGPTATVDTLPNFSVHGVDGEEEGRGEATGRIPRFESISRYSRDNIPEGGGREREYFSEEWRKICRFYRETSGFEYNGD